MCSCIKFEPMSSLNPNDCADQSSLREKISLVSLSQIAASREDPSHFVKKPTVVIEFFRKCHVTEQDLHEMQRFTIRLWRIHSLTSHCAHTWKVFSLPLIAVVNTRKKRKIRDRHQRHVEVLQTILCGKIKEHRSRSQSVPKTT